MSRHNPDTFNELDDELQGLFARATAQIGPRHDLAASLQQRLAQGGSVRAAGAHHAPRIAATLSAFLVVALLAGVFVWFGPGGVRSGAPGAPGSPTQTPPPAPLSVTSVALAVSPTSIAGTTCGSHASFTYTATFHIPAHTAGGTIQFAYTLNNGRSQTAGTVTVGAGETSKTFQFVSSGTLSADHTYPQPGGIEVTSPNQLPSVQIGPTGQCTPAAAPACGPNFSGSGSQSYQATLLTAFGSVPLPPLSRTVPNDASGGQRGYDICSAGTAATITAFMEQHLPAYGWTRVSISGGRESWQNSKGTINWSVADPLEWNINWRVPLG